MRCVGKPEGFHLNEVELVASDCYNVAFVVEVLSATDTADFVILEAVDKPLSHVRENFLEADYVSVILRKSAQNIFLSL